MEDLQGSHWVYGPLAYCRAVVAELVRASKIGCFMLMFKVMGSNPGIAASILEIIKFMNSRYNKDHNFRGGNGQTRKLIHELIPRFLVEAGALT